MLKTKKLKEKKMKKFLIFDFDGTIADSIMIGITLINRLAKQYHFSKTISAEYLKIIRQKRIQELFKELNIPLVKLPFFIIRYRREFNKHIPGLLPIKGVKQALSDLDKEGYLLGILTSNGKKNVEDFLYNNGLNMFDFIYGDIGLFGKNVAIKKIIKKQKLINSDVIYIGDEVRDFEAAQKAKIKIISVSWGLQGKKFLASYNPDLIIDYPRQLAKAVKKL